MGIGTARGGRGRDLPFGVVALGFLLAVPPPSMSAQGVLRTAALEVDLPSGPGPIAVRVRYEVRARPGALELPLTLLTPGDTRLSGLRASGADGELSLRLLRTRPHYWTGAVALPTGAPVEGEGGPGPPLGVAIAYRVEGGWDGNGRISIPIPAPAWVPEDPHPGTFRARVSIPGGVTVLESFPTSVVSRPEEAEGGSYELALQGMPSMVILRVTEGPAPLLTLERVLDALVLSVLALMGLAGLRYLRKAGP